MINQKDEKSKYTYGIGGMHCGGCAKTVEQKLTALPEVKSVKVDLVKKRANIVSDTAIKLSDLQNALDNTSYNITELNDNSSN